MTACGYEIEFYTADSEYEYKIDGTTGAVLESKQEARQTSGGSSTISEADAKRIALERAGADRRRLREGGLRSGRQRI